VDEPPKLRRRPAAPVVRRRLVGLAIVITLIAVGVWAATAAINKVRKTSTPATTAAPAPPPTYRIIFPEGFTREEMAGRIRAVNGIALRTRHFRTHLKVGDYLSLTGSSTLPGEYAGDGKARSLEGFLFPAEYDLFATDTASRLVNDQLAKFRRQFSRVDLRYSGSKNLTRYDVLIIASMIEKEAVVDKERPLIAAVIYNRLHARMPLAIDATIRYALHVPGTKSLTQADLRDPTPYNTRLNLGLPPTPISNPGLMSLRAAAHPAHVDYLYYVAKPDKRHHFFTASAEAFQAYAAAHCYGPHP
jgi:UPF0755 protein